jgi:hypothetical protein
MSGTVLVPVHLAARVVTTPSVQAPPFDGEAPVVLERGIHVHWALPDALNRAEVEERVGKKRLVFPAVPDLWLVARFAPVPSARGATASTRVPVQPVATRPVVTTARPAVTTGVSASVLAGLRAIAADRPWRGWVIESRTRRRIDLASWKLPAAYQTNQVLTAAGLLTVADGRPGWGVYPESAANFNPAAHAYYPEARNLFGFHDPLDDLANPYGDVTYVAIGWYRFANQDPVGCAIDRDALLDRWKLDYEPRSCPIPHELFPVTHSGAASAGELAGVRAVAAGRPGLIRARARIADTARSQAMKNGVGELVRAVNGDIASAIVDATPERWISRRGPDALVCHGALIEVDLTPQARASAIGGWTVQVAPSLQRALADVAADKGSDEWKAVVQAMILDAEQKTTTPSGLLGLPNEVHALGFQGRHGQSSYFAEISIHAKTQLRVAPVQPVVKATAGHWPAKARPQLATEAVAVEVRKPSVIAALGDQTTAPPEPTKDEITAFMAKLAQDIAAINADGKPEVHTRLVRVVDHRRKQPAFARVSAPSGPEGRTFWIDCTDRAAIKDLLILSTGAKVSPPSRATVFEVPGPRWYRPWSPHLVMTHVERSYRYGFDGRFDLHGTLVCRMNGYTLSSINTSVDGNTPDPVAGNELLGQTAALAKDGIPAITRNVLEEAMLIDPSNAKDIARAWLRNFKRDFPSATQPTATAIEKQFRNQITANLLRRDPELADVADLLQYSGEMPSEVAFMPWQQAWLPLFANVTYTYQPAAIGPLGPVECELGAAQGAPVTVTVTERRLLGATVAKVLDSAIVSKMVLDPNGHLVPANGPSDLDTDDFLRLDVLSTALTDCDEALFAKGVRLRAGTLRIDKVEVVGELGGTETVTAPAVLPADSPWQTKLAPRLPSWSRVQLRLMSATEPEAEADLTHSPVCGFLVPDLLEHTLEVYDAHGKALGQLVSDLPTKHSADTITATEPFVAKTPTPAVRYEPHPWQPAAITNPHLQSFVDGLCHAARTEQSPPGPLHESALTAMLRVIDTVRSTVDQTDKHGEKKVRMLGSPIAIVRSRLWLERTGAAKVTGDPPMLDDPLTISAKVGTATQPDDGVLGCFIPATTPGGDDAHFRPVDAGALKATLANGLAEAVGINGIDVCHTFVHDPAGDDTTFPVSSGQKRDLLLLLDINGGIYVTTGILPRKKIAMPKEFLSEALRDLEPSFRVGPVLAVAGNTAANAILPVPSIQGYQCEWVEHNTTDGVSVPPAPPEGQLPAARVSLTEGWLNLIHPK